VITGTFFLPLGVVLLAQSDDVVETAVRYDNVCPAGGPNPCEVNLTVEADMEPPIYVYYRLENFYQNHRDYVKSRDYLQLQGDRRSASDLDLGCDPLVRYRDGLDTRPLADTAEDSKIVFPCGLIANSFFNDTINADLCQGGSCATLVGENWRDRGQAWSSDLDEKFSDRSIDTSAETRESPNGMTLPAPDDEDFVVWMRTSMLPDFSKLYRRILNQKLEAGDVLRFSISSFYNVEPFDGRKYVQISTTGWAGGRNEFLPVLYIVVATLSYALALAFILHKLLCPSAYTFGDILDDLD